jgi:polyferredoxin
MIAAALGNDTPMLATYLAMSLAAGIVGDLIVARYRPSPARPVAFGLFGALVPGTYFGTYFLVTVATGGVWWSWTLTLGAIVWSMLCGLALTLLAGGRNESDTG